MLEATENFHSHARRQRRRYLKWTTASFIKETCKHVLDESDRFLIQIDKNSQLISDVNDVRNHIAHKASSTRQRFKDVVRRTYGYNRNVTPSQFLISPAGVTTPNLDTYIQASKIAISDISSGK